ncbi:LPD5 domain-containing protein [Draconibacterium mangrovi]|uniref:LPD5 domain-containing protein n=1 Tax=Draconibacterium mangrovi TaxID=2697469 RepID=UPI0013D07D32|nr:LPD5 domain-containing protein [Draconibacterium mangrovi]
MEPQKNNINTYSVDGKLYAIPQEKNDSFLKSMPNAAPVYAYEVNGKKLGIPKEKVNDFLKDVPNAKALYDYPDMSSNTTQPLSSPENMEEMKDTFKSNPRSAMGMDVGTAKQVAQSVAADNIGSRQAETNFSGNRDELLTGISAKITQLDQGITDRTRNDGLLDKAFSGDVDDTEYLARNLYNRSLRQAQAVSGNGGTGVGDALKDRNFWTLGATDLTTAVKLKKVANKIDNNEPLTKPELLLLDAWRTNEEVNMAFPVQDAKQGYQVGKSVTDMIPWLAQFAATRGSGTAGRKAVTQSLLKGAEKYLGKKIGSIAAKGAGEVAGAYAASALMPQTYTGIVDRSLGQTTKDANGNIGFDKSTAEKPLEAIYKGWTSGALEVLTERLGEGIEATKYYQKLPKARIAERMFGPAGKRAAENFGKFTKAVGWNGAPLEYLEEWVNIPANAILVGDSEFKEMFDGPQQLTTFLTVLAMGKAMGITNTAVSAISAYGEGMQQDREDAAAAKLFNDNVPEPARNQINEILNNPEISIEQQGQQLFGIINGLGNKEAQGAVINYISTLNRWNKQQDAEQVVGSPVNQEQQTPTVDPADTYRAQVSDFINQNLHSDGSLMRIKDDEDNEWFVSSGKMDDADGILIVYDANSPNGKKGIAVSDVQGEPEMVTPDEFMEAEMQRFAQQEQVKQEIKDQSVTINGQPYLVLGDIEGDIGLQPIDENGQPLDANPITMSQKEFEAATQQNEEVVNEADPLSPSDSFPQVGSEQPLQSNENVATEPAVAPQIVNTVKIGKNNYKYTIDEAGSFNIQLEQGQDPVKAEKEIRATLPDDQQHRIQLTQQEVEIPSSVPWVAPTKQVVTTGITVLPENTSPPQLSSKQDESVNNLENKSEKLTETNSEKVNSQDDRDLQIEESLQENTIVTTNEQANQPRRFIEGGNGIVNETISDNSSAISPQTEQTASDSNLAELTSDETNANEKPEEQQQGTTEQVEQQGETVPEKKEQDRAEGLGEETQISLLSDELQQAGEIADEKESVQRAEAEVNTNPTEGQKEAGNYKKGHARFSGFDITIENPTGSTRSGKDQSGNKWSVTMNNNYGYFKRTKGKDGDQVDVFLGPNNRSQKVYVVDQIDPKTMLFDEHKVMLGFNSEQEAREAYLSNYSESWPGLGAITEMKKPDFKKWLGQNDRKKGPKRKPVSKLVQTRIKKQPTLSPEEKQQRKENKAKALAIEPLSLEQHILQYIVSGNRLNWGEIKRELFPRSRSELNKRFWMLKADAQTIDELLVKDGAVSGTDFEQEAREPNVWRNAVLDVILSNSTMTEMVDRILAIGEAQVNDIEQQENRMAEAMMEAERLDIANMNEAYAEMYDQLENNGELPSENELNNLFLLDNDTEENINEGAVSAENGETDGTGGRTDRGKPDSDSPENPSQLPTEESLNPNQEKIDKAQTELTTLQSRLKKKEAEINSRNGIFGDTASKPGGLFIDEQFDMANAQQVVEGIKAEITKKEQEIEQLTKAGETAAIENSGQTSITEPTVKSESNKDLTDNEVVSNRKQNKSVLESNKNQEPRFLSDVIKPTGSVSPSPTTEKRIDDFGEKIAGAKKDIYSTLQGTTRDDIVSKPLSKSFPRPDFAKLVAEGLLTKEGALVTKFLYDNIPAKPRKKFKIESWAKQVQEAINVYSDLLSEKGMDKKLIEAFKKSDRGAISSKWETFSITQEVFGFPEVDLNTGAYEIKRFINSEGERISIVKSPYILSDHKTIEDAAKALKSLIENNKEKSKGTKFSVYQDTKTKNFFIGKKTATGVLRLVDGLERSEAFTMLKNQHAQLQELWDNKKKNPNERRSTNRARVGTDYRNGKDITPEEFTNEFGFRGVQFGNWVNNQERQDALNDAYDALRDLATALNISSRAISLGGELGLAFGARGSGGKQAPSAHYESGQVVINLTKRSGAGSLAHEWWHALDNYFSRKRGKNDFLTEKPRQGVVVDGRNVVPDERIRKEMHEAFQAVVDKIKASGLPKRSEILDETRSKRYWSQMLEMTARSFENFIIEKLGATNEQNDYLANFKEIGDWITDGGLEMDSYPYPLEAETGEINEAFQQLFNTIQEKTDDEGNTILFRKGDVFYSPTEKALAGIKQDKGTPEQMKAMLLKNGAKQAELDWMDWGEFIDNKTSITTQDIQDWIDENKIEVEEVQKGRITNELTEQERKDYEELEDQVMTDGEESLSENDLNYYNELSSRVDKEYDGTATETKYHQYQLPGGENYKELLLTMPQEKAISLDQFLIEKGIDPYSERGQEIMQEGSTDPLAVEYNQRYGNRYTNGDFKSSHFDEPNILAHIRFNERTDAEGNKVLFLEEIQSDWAQKGKKKGFKGEGFPDDKAKRLAELESIMREQYGSIVDMQATNPELGNELWDLRQERLAVNTKDIGSVPNMPFKKTDQWVNLALRRMIRYAAENGFDRIAWTTGEQQAERYDLSKQVDAIYVSMNKDGKYDIHADNNSEGIEVASNIPKEKIEDYIGKELAKKAVNDLERKQIESDGNPLTTKTVTYEGNDLKVGGEGMKAFYNSIVPKLAGKLGKKFGAKVEPIEFGSKKGKNFIEYKKHLENKYGVGFKNSELTEQEFDNLYELKEESKGEIRYSQQLSLPITEQMKETALVKGMPMFSKNSNFSRNLSGKNGLDQKHEATKWFVNYLNKLSGNIAKTEVVKELNELPDLMEEAGVSKERVELMRKEISEGVEIYGLENAGIIYIVSETNNTHEQIAQTWLHEISHSIVRNEYSNAELVELYDTIGEKYIQRILPKNYHTESKSAQANELIAFSVENLSNNNRLDDILRGNVDYNLLPLALQFALHRVTGRFKEYGTNNSEIRNNADAHGSTQSSSGQVPRNLQQTTKNGPAQSTGTGQRRSKSRFLGDILYSSKAAPQTETPEFKSWFGNSKIVNEDGSPMVVYHGTARDFNEFSKAKAQDKEGRRMEVGWGKSKFYFADTGGAASIAASGAEYFGKGKNQSVMPVYLRMEKPIDSDKYEALVASKVAEGLSRDKAISAVDKQIKKEGYDGIISDTGGMAVFEPTQIKSATGNNGGFDPNNPDIRFKKKTPPPKEPGDSNFLGDHLEEAGKRYNERETARNFKEWIGYVRQSWQDKNLPIRKLEEEVQKRGGRIWNKTKPYRDINLSFGRMERLYRDFHEENMVPVLEAISELVKASKINHDYIIPYIYAKHAEERNRSMRMEEYDRWLEVKEADGEKVSTKERNEKLDQLDKKDYSGVSSFSDEDIKPDDLANMMVEEFEQHIDQKYIDNLWEAVNKASGTILDHWLKGGQISQKQYNHYKSQYKYFVPLRGWRHGLAKTLRYHSSNGFGRSLRHSEGRTSLADNPLSNMEAVAFKAIGERVNNEVNQSLLNLVMANYDRDKFSDLYSVKKVYYIRDTEINPETHEQEEVWVPTIEKPSKELFDSGDVKTEYYKEHMKLRSGFESSEHEVIIKRDGGDVAVVFPDEYLSTAQSFNRQNTIFKVLGKFYDSSDLDRLSKITGAGGLTNFMKAMFTSSNPVFPFTNFFRDVPEAAFSMLIGEGNPRVMKNVPKAMATVRRYLYGKPTGNVLDKQFQDFYHIGGATGYTHEKTPQEIEKDLKKELKRILQKGTFKGATVNQLVGALNAFQKWNQLFEDTTRFAVYLSSLEAGNSKEDAAMHAKEASVNFNRKGKVSKVVDSVWAFFNVAIQAAQKNFKLAKDHPGRFTAVAGSVAMLGFFEAMLNDMFDDDDDYYDINDWVRRNYANFKLGDKYIRIPLPQFWRGFHSMGVIAYDLFAKGKTTGKQATYDTVLNFIGGLSPIDIPGFWVEGEFKLTPLVPTYYKPIQELIDNRNFMQSRIYKEPYTKKLEEQLASSTLHKKNVNPAIKMITDFLARDIGGRYGNLKFDVKDGKVKDLNWWLDWNPSKIEHIITSYLGGSGKAVSDMVTTLVQLFSSEEEVDIDNVPFINAFIRNTPDSKWSVIGKYYDYRDISEKFGAVEDYAYRERDVEKLEQLSSDQLKVMNALFSMYDDQITDLIKKIGMDSEEGAKEVTQLMQEAVTEVEKIINE